MKEMIKKIERRNTDSLTLCYTIIKLLIEHNIVTKEEAIEQVKKSIDKVNLTYQELTKRNNV